MIELDIKIKAKDQETVKLFTEIMMKGLAVANQMGEINVHLSAEKDGDTITLVRKEITKFDSLTKSESVQFTRIMDFISESDLSVRAVGILTNHSSGQLPFPMAEDITKERFLKLPNAGNRSWEEVEAELKRQKIKY